MKLKVYVIDLEIPLRVRKWGLRIGIPVGFLLGAGAVAWAAGLHTWMKNDVLNASDLNSNFSNLDTRLTTVEGEAYPASGFRATRITPLSIISNTNTKVIFDNVVFDKLLEYDTAGGVFTPKNDGTYLITCGISYAITGASGEYGWTAGIIVSGTDGGTSELDGVAVSNAMPAGSADPRVVTTVHLVPGESVYCSTSQFTGSNQSIDQSFGLTDRTSFSATRLY